MPIRIKILSLNKHYISFVPQRRFGDENTVQIFQESDTYSTLIGEVEIKDLIATLEALRNYE